MIRELYRSIDTLPELADIDSAEYVKAMAQAEIIKDALYHKLTPELLKDFDDFVEQQDVVATSAREDGFVQGFRFAARLMLDI